MPAHTSSAHYRSPRSRGLSVVIILALLFGMVAGLLPVGQPVAAAADPCASPANEIVAENCKPGVSWEEWDIDGAGDPSIQGFATDISVNKGETVRFKIRTSASEYRLNIYRMGYYGGLGARRITTVTPSAALPQTQPNCLRDSATLLTDCGNWAVSASWQVPADAVSGIYFAKVVNPANNDASHIVFVVRDDDGRSDLLFQTSDTTWQAYNRYGGSSLYYTNVTGRFRAHKVSYNRPFDNRSHEPMGWVFGVEYPMVKWMEANGYDVSYSTGVDSDRRGAELREHRAFLSVGHDEYWSGTQRANVEAARAAGVNLAFFSGNEVFWKTRWEPSIDGGGASHRTLVCYKETHDNQKIDPSPEWTGTWRDPRFSPPSDGGRPENALTGTMFTVNTFRNDPMEVPAEYGKLRFWRNTSVADLAPSQKATLPEGVLGYEWDEDMENGHRPAGMIRMSSTTRQVGSYILDYGNIYGEGTATHHLTLYRHSSGALVFGAGTVQWPWGLDEDHDRGGTPADQRMRQATMNLFADMGAQPATIQPGLVRATASTDRTPPKSVITSPISGASVQAGTPVTISGTAADAEGVVGGVEVSVDNGTTWKVASGRENWTYTWTPERTGEFTLLARASDDSANREIPTAGTTVTSKSRPCPCSFWSDATVPSVASSSDAGAIELGIRFRSEEAGYITGVRFYKGAENTGTHLGHLWDENGTMLAEATFRNETASGWQQVNFETPVAVEANRIYTASYHTTTGHFAVDRPYFNTPIVNAPLRAVVSGSADGVNGVYKGGEPGFPTGSYLSSNYWVDVVFKTTLVPDTTAPKVSAVSPGDGATDVSAGTTVSATFDEAMDASTLGGSNVQLRDAAGTLVQAAASYNTATHSVTLTPATALARSTLFTATVRGGGTGAKDSAGNALAADYSWSFTTTAANAAPAVINPGSQTTAEGQTVRLSVQATDPDNDRLAYSATGLPAGLSIESGTGKITGTISAGAIANSPYAATVTVSDGIASASASFRWTVTDANRAPVVTDPGTQTTPEGDSVSLQVQVSDFENDPLTYSAEGLPPGLTINPSTGLISGTAVAPAAANSPHAVTVTVSDGMASGSASFTWVVTRPCPCSIWDDSRTPGTTGTTDALGHELGVKFRADVDGYITGIKFYKGAENTGTHLGHLWSADGTLLAEATFTNETVTGWQRVSFGTPVAIRAGTTYVASYYTPAGHFAADRGYFTTATNNAPLRALANGQDGSNGVYKVGESGFPAAADAATNYWVDVVFSQEPPAPTTATITAVSPAADATNATAGTVVSATFSEAMDPTSLTSNTFRLRNAAGVTVAGSVSYNATTKRASLAPSAALTPGERYTATIVGGGNGVRDIAGNAFPADYSWSFTVRTCPCSLFDASAVPQVASSPDPGAIELGVKFRADTNGYVTGVRFYKGAQNTGTHLGHLWGADGTMLAEATFTDETATGWQQVSFDEPVAVAANTTYVASYHTPTGYFSVDRSYFDRALDNPPLHALANGQEGGNAVYKGGTPGFPTGSYAASNYWVDVVFTTSAPVDTTPPTVVSVTPAADASDVAMDAVAAAKFSKALDPATVNASTVQLRNAQGEPVPGAVAYAATARTATLTPASLLTPGARYTAVVEGGAAGVKDKAGNPLAEDRTWTFTVKACPCSLWDDSTVPAVTASDDTALHELGFRFRSKVDGYISGVRYYKGAANTGIHLGHLWDNAGTLLAEATFTDETASGWQEVHFDVPVAIKANTTYVASYYTPVGHFAMTRSYFDRAYSNGPLTALADGQDGPTGAYKPGASGFPTGSYMSSNYWVDVVFTTTAPPNTTITDGPPGATRQTAASFAFSASAADATFECRLDGGEYAPCTSPKAYDGLADGEHTVRVRATDAAGSTDPSPARRTWRVDTTAPDAPAITAPADNSVTNASEVRLAGTAEAGSTVEVFEGAASRGTVETGADGQWSRTITGVGDGEHTYTAKATDAVGNTSPASAGRTITVDSIGPAKPTVDLAAASDTGSSDTDDVTSDATPALGGDADAGSVVEIRDTRGGATSVLATVTANASGTWEYALTEALADGAHAITVIARDGAGNASPASDALNVAVDTAAPRVSDSAPADQAADVDPNARVRVTFSEAMWAGTITNSTVTLTKQGETAPVAGTMTYEVQTHTAELAPSRALDPGASYTARLEVSARDVAGNALGSDQTWSFSIKGCPCSLWSDAQTPSIAAVDDAAAHELGVKFRADVDGYITSVRFYKGATNTGTHLGHLWEADGTMLAEATFADETATGWQQVSFAEPVAIQANTTYVASYHAPNGHFAVDRSYFDRERASGPLRALASGADGGNGVYKFGGSGFPTGSYGGSNYWVDVVFATSVPAGGTEALTTGTATSAEPGSGSATIEPASDRTDQETATEETDTSAPTILRAAPTGGTTVTSRTAITATFSEPVDGSTLNGETFTVTRKGSVTPLRATVAYDPAARRATAAPSVPLQPSTTCVVAVEGARAGVADLSGNPLKADKVWSFTTADTAAPILPAAPSRAIATPSGLSGGAVPVDLGWKAATDGAGSGIAGYELRRKINGDAWGPVARATATTHRALLAPGAVYRFQVRARDRAGNASGWKTGPAFRVELLQDSAPAVAYADAPSSGWSSARDASASGGTTRLARTAGPRAVFRFRGAEVAWVATKAADRGRAAVWLDGRRVAVVDLYSATRRTQQIVYRAAVTPGTDHVLELRTLAARNPASRGTIVEVDAFAKLR